jgi:hypothetical protein
MIVVILAKAGIQARESIDRNASLDSRLRGNDDQAGSSLR